MISLSPTFTLGFVLGQLSIVFLIYLVLRYIFFEPVSETPKRPTQEAKLSVAPGADGKANIVDLIPESAEWFNVVLEHIAQAYRKELTNGNSGASGNESARLRVQQWINDRRGTSALDIIEVHSVSLGSAAPRLEKARIIPPVKPGLPSCIECDVSYEDAVSISISTSMLLHYPTAYFARLPVSLTMSLKMFTAKVSVIPPTPNDPSPCLTLSLDPSFNLDLDTTSLLGSKAKLSNVPKVHELITQRIRNTLSARGTWKIVLPGVHAKDVVNMLEKRS